MNLKKVFAYRNVWMGLAMLWIVFMHMEIGVSNTVLSYLKQFGYGGVDIFLFASGIGCYCSLEKDGDYVRFIKRRALRILPTYWCFCIVWSIYQYKHGMLASDILGNFLCIETFTGSQNSFNWYICAIWLLYFLAPFFKGLVDRIHSWIGLFIFMIILVVFTIPFWYADMFIIIVTRIPIFFLGMFFGKLSTKELEQKDFRKLTALSVAAMLLGIACLALFVWRYPARLWSCGFYWYPFILITPGLCILISYAMEYLKKIKIGAWFETILSFVGKHSFEVYLIHIWFYEILTNDYIAVMPETNTAQNWWLTTLFVIPACVILHYASKLVMMGYTGITNKVHK